MSSACGALDATVESFTRQSCPCEQNEPHYAQSCLHSSLCGHDNRTYATANR